MHLTQLLTCIHTGTMPFVKKMAARPQPGARAANTLQATMQWPEYLGFPPCFNTQVADATFLYGAYRSLDALFFRYTRAEGQPRFDAARAHLRICIQLSCLCILKEPFVFKCHHEWKESNVRVINTVLIWMPDTKQGTNRAIHMAHWEWLHLVAVRHFQVAVVCGDVE